MNKIIRYIAAYGLWIIALLLGAWLFNVTRVTFHYYLVEYFTRQSLARSYQGRFYEPVFAIVIGMGWLIFMVVSEEYLRKSIKDGGMIRLFCRFAGIEVLLIFLVDFLFFTLQGFPTSNWLHILILVFELLLGVAITFLGYSSRSPLPRKTRPSISGPSPFSASSS